MNSNPEDKTAKLNEVIEKMYATIHKRNKWLRTLNKEEKEWLDLRRSLAQDEIIEALVSLISELNLDELKNRIKRGIASQKAESEVPDKKGGEGNENTR